MLQARLLSYPDAHRYRIGINYAQLPVNKPRCPVHSYHRDGHMRFDGNFGGAPGYQPNSFGGPVEIEREGATTAHQRQRRRYDHWVGNADYWTQPGNSTGS